MPFIDTPETNALKSKVEKILSEIPDFADENKNLKNQCNKRLCR